MSITFSLPSFNPLQYLAPTTLKKLKYNIGKKMQGVRSVIRTHTTKYIQSPTSKAQKNVS